MPNRRPIIDLRRDLKFFAVVLGAILLIMLLGTLLNTPSLLTPAMRWSVGVCLLNKTLASTTYIITVNANTTLYNIETTPSNCTVTPGLPLTGPAIVQLACGGPLERVFMVTNHGSIAFNETAIAKCLGSS
jgi:hypothetical protein